MKRYHILLLVTCRTPLALTEDTLHILAVNAFLQTKLSGIWLVDEKGEMEKVADEDYHTPREVLTLEFTGDRPVAEAGQFRIHCKLAKENPFAVRVDKSVVTLPLTEFTTGATKLLDIGATEKNGRKKVTYTLRD